MHKECGWMIIFQGGACDGLHTRGRGFAAGLDRTVTTICGWRRSLYSQEGGRKAWGERTNTKTELAKRNAGIYTEYLSGRPIKELAEKYFLAEKSIQRIIRQERQRL